MQEKDDTLFVAESAIPESELPKGKFVSERVVIDYDTEHVYFENATLEKIIGVKSLKAHKVPFSKIYDCREEKMDRKNRFLSITIPGGMVTIGDDMPKFRKLKERMAEVARANPNRTIFRTSWFREYATLGVIILIPVVITVIWYIATD